MFKFSFKKPKLVMTLLARDEEDIIERNICFHLNHGVDFILAVNNDSEDNTEGIFKKYARLGYLTYKNIKKHSHEQSKWVSEMAKEAVKDYGATHLFHCDADEFWYPESGDLKARLPMRNEVFYVSVKNYLPDGSRSDDPEKHLVVDHPLEYVENKGADRCYRMFLYCYPPKVMTTSMFTDVWQGNHLILDKKPQKRVDIDHIYIHHFPIRSYEQFEKKTINGGLAYEKNPDRSPELGWHKKEWYRLYKAGLLKEVFNQICLNDEERKILIHDKVLKYVQVPRSVLKPKGLDKAER